MQAAGTPFRPIRAGRLLPLVLLATMAISACGNDAKTATADLLPLQQPTPDATVDAVIRAGVVSLPSPGATRTVTAAPAPVRTVAPTPVSKPATPTPVRRAPTPTPTRRPAN